MVTDSDKITSIPDVITLNGFPIKTEYSKTLFADREQFGEFCCRNMDITLDENLSMDSKILWYCHEVTEAIIHINHLKIEDEQEKQAIGIGIYQILMQHNKFFKRSMEQPK